MPFRVTMLPISDYNYKIEKKENLKFFGKVKLKILVVFAVSLSLLLISQLVFASNLTSDGQRMQEFAQELDKLETENQILKAEIAKVSSLSQLSQKAEKLGLSKPAKLLTP